MVLIFQWIIVVIGRLQFQRSGREETCWAMDGIWNSQQLRTWKCSLEQLCKNATKRLSNGNLRPQAWKTCKAGVQTQWLPWETMKWMNSKRDKQQKNEKNPAIRQYTSHLKGRPWAALCGCDDCVSRPCKYSRVLKNLEFLVKCSTC